MSEVHRLGCESCGQGRCVCASLVRCASCDCDVDPSTVTLCLDDVERCEDCAGTWSLEHCSMCGAALAEADEDRGDYLCGECSDGL